jgi:hypothetical protein
MYSPHENIIFRNTCLNTVIEQACYGENNYMILCYDVWTSVTSCGLVHCYVRSTALTVG